MTHQRDSTNALSGLGKTLVCQAALQKSLILAVSRPLQVRNQPGMHAY